MTHKGFITIHKTEHPLCSVYFVRNDVMTIYKVIVNQPEHSRTEYIFNKKELAIEKYKHFNPNYNEQSNFK
jgi:hypothetical protein